MACPIIPLTRETIEEQPDIKGLPALIGVVSLLDMLRFYAATFLSMSHNIASLYMYATVAGEEWANPKLTEKAPKALAEMRDGLQELGLDSVSQQAARILARLPSLQRSDLAILLIELRDSINYEFTNHLFFKIDGRLKHAYLKPSPSAEIASAFSRAVPDFEDANKCLVLDQPNASVFHLMRVLEIGLQCLAARFSVAYDRRNWENVINDIEAAIKKIDKATAGPNWKDEEHFYAESASHFRFLKNAWRNYVMHVHQRYSIPEAANIQNHVTEFMQHLSSRLDDKSLP